MFREHFDSFYAAACCSVGTEVDPAPVEGAIVHRQSESLEQITKEMLAKIEANRLEQCPEQQTTGKKTIEQHEQATGMSFSHELQATTSIMKRTKIFTWTSLFKFRREIWEKVYRVSESTAKAAKRSACFSKAQSYLVILQI